MSRIVADRVLETSSTTGTGAFTLSGAVTGFRTFASVCAVGDTVDYVIMGVDSNGIPTGDWETGRGTYSASATLTRTTIQASSNSGSVVSFGAGTKHVMLSHNATSLDRWDFRPALASYFTLLSTDATNLTLTDDPDVGLLVEFGALADGATRAVYKTLTSKTLAWDLKVKLTPFTIKQNYSNLGIVLQDSASGKCLKWMHDSSSDILVTRHSDLYTYAGTEFAISYPGYLALITVRWLRVQFDGTNLTFSLSADGKIWIVVLVTAYTTYLGVQPDRIGLCINTTRTTGLKPAMSVQYWSLTGPAV